VTWHWLEGNKRARILVSAIISSKTFILDMISVTLAGVMAVVYFTISARGTFTSQSILANFTESMAIASSA